MNNSQQQTTPFNAESPATSCALPSSQTAPPPTAGSPTAGSPTARQQTARQQTVLLGVTGSIAAYKACELVRLLQKAGLRVKVCMTQHATELVGAATFRALTGEPVAVAQFDSASAPIHHISLAEEADLLLIAPATANILNKIANGIADDLLSTTALATKAPLMVAPAMNVNMLQNQRTQESLARLEAQGVTVVGPGEGYLACGVEDAGRMSEPAEIAAAVLALLQRTRSLAGKRVLITTGATREFFDPVRFISSPASGRTGFALAREAAARGAEVVLISGPTSLPAPFGVHYLPVVSALDMLDAASEHFEGTDLAIFAAAVADFRPAYPVAQKIKNKATVVRAHTGAHTGEEEAGGVMQLELVQNPDILATLASRRNAQNVCKARDAHNAHNAREACDIQDAHNACDACDAQSTQKAGGVAEAPNTPNTPGTLRPFIVGFAAETEQVLENAQAKLVQKGADLIVANDVSKPGLGFASTHNRVLLVSATEVRETELLHKEKLAALILDAVQEKL